jgi:acetyltransferase-like isoleucine patch superfamily enzyme
MSLEKNSSSYIIEPYHIISYDSRKSDGEMPKIKIGKYCSIAINCSFILSNHVTNRFTTAPFYTGHMFPHGKGNKTSYSKGDIIICNDVWIGANCSIIDGITIGNGAVIAAGSVVIKNVEPYSIVGGNPAKHIKYRLPEDIIKRIEATRFWELPIEQIQKFNLWEEDIENTVKNIENTVKNSREDLWEEDIENTVKNSSEE